MIWRLQSGGRGVLLLAASGFALFLAGDGRATSGGLAPMITALPVRGAWAAVELAPGVDPADLAQVLGGGYPMSPHDPRYWRIPTTDLNRARSTPGVVRAWGMPPLTAPPADLAPPTPDFTPDQAWWDSAGVRAAHQRPGGRWPGASGDGVALFDVEYAWDPDHEDLAGHVTALAGLPAPEFAYHGNASLGIAGARDDGYGTTGGAPAAALVVVYPILSNGAYDVGWALSQAADVAQAGDVVLIEQQALDAWNTFVPVSIEPGTAAAMQALTAAGVVVIEPAGNGAANLDDPKYQGAFQLDRGAWTVGAAGAGRDVRATFSGYGTPVDLYLDGSDTIAPTTAGFQPDLFFPGGDPRQAYTRQFGGTSGASAQVAGLAASLQGASIALFGAPVPPRTLLAWVRASGRPQNEEDAAQTPIGVRPDLDRTLRDWLSP
jgi:hypothetical protein